MDKLFSNMQKSLSGLQNKTDKNMDKDRLLERQQKTQEKINSLLETSSQALLCGPTCQKLKVTEELRQKYLDAETNLLTAPIKLEQSKKNYYVFSEGRTYYENMKDEELKEKAETIGKLLKENFNEEISNANTMNSYLNIALVNSENTKELLKEYLKKNKELKLKLRESHGDILTNDRKTYYETDALDRLKSWYTLLWYIYYLLVLVLVLGFIFSPSNLKMFVKIIIVVVFVLYPYFISYIVKLVYDLWVSIVNRLPKNVYNNL